jgi:hypothetical protein
MDDKPLAARIPFPVPLAWLAERDAGAVSGSLPDAVGDNYLCANNPTFAALRRAALDLGFRFSSADTPLWRDYGALPLVTIDRIIEERTIPLFRHLGLFAAHAGGGCESGHANEYAGGATSA